MRGSYKTPNEKTSKKAQAVPRFRQFSNIGGYSGVWVHIFCLLIVSQDSYMNNFKLLLLLFQVFVCGPYPHWIFVSNRGALRCHPMTVDGTVTCFVTFHNINCPRGFLYFNNQVSAFLKYKISD